MDYVQNILLNVLTTLYTYLGFSLLLGFCFVFLYMYIEKYGIKSILKWVKDSRYRKIFLFATVVTLILFRTLLNRDIWMNPLSDVFGGWGIEVNGDNINTEAIENIILFIPFSFLLIYVFNLRYRTCILYSVGFSLCIESCQLFFRLGTFQIADLVYNSLGGIIGVVVYIVLKCCIQKIRAYRHSRA